MFGGCDEDDIVSMTQDLALSEGYDVAVFVQVKGLELGTSASGLKHVYHCFPFTLSLQSTDQKLFYSVAILVIFIFYPEQPC